MSNVPTCALFMSLELSIIKANGDPKPGTSNLGSALMIGIPAGAVLGSFMIPASTPTNIIAISLIEDVADIHISFLEWMIVGAPTVIICIIIVSAWITTVFKPEPVTKETQEYIKRTVEENGPLTAKDKKILTNIVLMVTC